MTTLGLNDVSLTQLPQDIGQLTNLKSLEVRENLIRTLPTSIAFLAQLQRLDLGQNELDELVSASCSAPQGRRYRSYFSRPKLVV